MKLKILATAILTATICLPAIVRAENTLQLRQLGAVRSSVLVAQSDWGEFSSVAGRFTVLIPGTPTQESETNEDGFVEHSFTLTKERSAFLIHYSDIPEAEELSDTEIQQLLDSTPTDFVKEAKAQLLASRSITLDGNPGKEFEFTLRDGTPGAARVYLVKQRLYVIVGMASDAENTQKFVNSFRLL
ncbi:MULTISPECIES: hypothetical protein [Aerosakkonema]|uniref:hypothetical protein n=1 Tax=Aerosakkonema TaxID=1246629 RepID=UPI0035B7A3F1